MPSEPFRDFGSSVWFSLCYLSAWRCSSSSDTAAKTFPVTGRQFSGYNKNLKWLFQEFARALTYNYFWLKLLLYFKVPITVLTINAILESGDVQHLESFHSKRDDRVNSLTIQVKQEKAEELSSLKLCGCCILLCCQLFKWIFEKLNLDEWQWFKVIIIVKGLLLLSIVKGPVQL